LQAWCINLDKRPERWARMQAEAGKAGFAFERVAAVDGTRPDIAAAAAAVPIGRLGMRMSAGAYGCFLSHREAWSRLVASGEPWGMVAEDDLLLSPGLGALMRPDWIPGDADVVKVETRLVRAHVSRQTTAEVDGRRVAQLLGSHIAAGCYMLSAATAARLLRETETFSDGVDHVLFDADFPFFPTARIYQVAPAPSVQGSLWREFDQVPDWAQTSMAEHFVDAPPPESWKEGPLGRARRRLREEAHALRLGSRYEVVPFG
jgi:glycosyl transferase family 25